MFSRVNSFVSTVSNAQTAFSEGKVLGCYDSSVIGQFFVGGTGNMISKANEAGCTIVPLVVHYTKKRAFRVHLGHQTGPHNPLSLMQCLYFSIFIASAAKNI